MVITSWITVLLTSHCMLVFQAQSQSRRSRGRGHPGPDPPTTMPYTITPQWKRKVEKYGPVPCPQPSCAKAFEDPQQLVAHVVEHTVSNRERSTDNFVCIMKTVNGPCREHFTKKAYMVGHIKAQ